MANDLGFLDVDEMLGTIAPEQLDERIAYYQLSGTVDSREIAATIQATIHNEMTRYLEAKSGKRIDSWRTGDDYLPEIMRRPSKQSRRIEATDENAAKRFSMALGFNGRN